MKWIKCSERLPENDDDVIVMTNKNKMHTAIGWMERNSLGNGYDREWVDNLRMSTIEDYLDPDEKIVYWAELPDQGENK